MIFDIVYCVLILKCFTPIIISIPYLLLVFLVYFQVHSAVSQSGPTCAICLAGKFKTNYGVEPCMNCYPNTYSNKSGAYSDSTCLPCPSNTNSRAGSPSRANCLCNPGWTGVDGGPCSPCALDTYKNSSGSAPCTACPAGSFAVEASDTLSNCSCKAGFQWEASEGLTCTACPPGKYNPLNNSVSQNECVSCPSGSVSDPASDELTDCSQCTAGTYTSATADTCEACPASSVSPAASINRSACLCNAGYSGQDGGECLPCPADTYKTGVGERASTAVCSDQTGVGGSIWMDASGASCAYYDTYPEDCGLHESTQYCCACRGVPGSYWTNVISNDSYHAEWLRNRDSTWRYDTSVWARSACAACPANSAGAPAGSVSATACLCKAGYSGPDGGECTACPAGKYKDTAGSAACVCLPGSIELDSKESCSLCLEHHYCPDQTREIQCPPHSHSPAGSVSLANCSCVAGFFGPPGACEVCAVNTYCEGGLEYTPCPANSSTYGLQQRNRSSECECLSGFHRVDETCVECASGSFCFDETMFRCPQNASSPRGSSACTCDPDFQARASETGALACEACPLHLVCPGGGAPVEVCALGALNRGGDCVCGEGLICTGLFSCSGNATACVCQAGYEPVLGAPAPAGGAPECAPCRLGYSKPVTGGAPCQPCPIGQFSNATAGSACTVCAHVVLELGVAGATTTPESASTSIANCTCLAGHYRDGGLCAACVAGKYKPEKSFEACLKCGTAALKHHYGKNETGAVSSAHCVQCPAFSGNDERLVDGGLVMDSVAKCLCFAGHDTWSTEACERCGNYTFKTGYSNADCRSCEADSYWISRNQPCITCSLPSSDGAAPHSVAINARNHSERWGQGEQDCACRMGYERIHDQCHQCAAGSYRGQPELEAGVRLCTKCGPDHFQPQGGAEECVQCPASSSFNGTGAVRPQDCLCDDGHYWVDGACSPCPAGTFKKWSAHMSVAENTAVCAPCAPDTYSLGTASACTSCAANMFAAEGADSAEKCYCNAGFGVVSDPGACEPCPNATYWGGGAVPRQRCPPCPQNKTSPVGSEAEADCRCVPGHGVASDSSPSEPCLPCVSGSFAPGGNRPCESCGWGTVTEPAQAAAGPESCRCDAGRGLIETDAS